MSEKAITSLNPEERLRKATTAAEVACVLISFLGEGRKAPEIVSLFVDAKIEDSQIPEGTDRESLKKGIVEVLNQAKKFWKLK
jgi:hypothetical protein